MNSVKMINRGMITIPASLRKQFGYQDGMEFFIETDETGIITLVPMMDVLKVHDWYKSSGELIESIQELHESEIKKRNKVK